VIRVFGRGLYLQLMLRTGAWGVEGVVDAWTQAGFAVERA